MDVRTNKDNPEKIKKTKKQKKNVEWYHVFVRQSIRGKRFVNNNLNLHSYKQTPEETAKQGVWFAVQTFTGFVTQNQYLEHTKAGIPFKDPTIQQQQQQSQQQHHLVSQSVKSALNWKCNSVHVGPAGPEAANPHLSTSEVGISLYRSIYTMVIIALLCWWYRQCRWPSALPSLSLSFSWIDLTVLLYHYYYHLYLAHRYNFAAAAFSLQSPFDGFHTACRCVETDPIEVED